MSVFHHYTSHGLGKAVDAAIEAPSVNHKNAGDESEQIKAKIASLGLTRLAGNVYECPSTKDFWAVRGGKVMRISSGDEFDNGESLVAAPSNSPAAFLEQILGDLTF